MMGRGMNPMALMQSIQSMMQGVQNQQAPAGIGQSDLTAEPAVRPNDPGTERAADGYGSHETAGDRP